MNAHRLSIRFLINCAEQANTPLPLKSASQIDQIKASS
jgi:hypothetical protein